MLNSQRMFVTAVKEYCANHGIAVEIASQGWLLVLQRGTERHLTIGYDLGLNSSVAHQIASDKAAAAELLTSWGIPCVPHALFLGPSLSEYVASTGSWEAMLVLLKQNPQGIVVKPNDGTGGDCVFKVLTRLQLELAVTKIFSFNRSLAICPYLEIEAEVRVIVVDSTPIIVYGKSRPDVVGDGRRSLLALALAGVPSEQLSAILPAMVRDLDEATLHAIVPAGHRQVLNWRHNLGSGALPVILEQGAARQACVELALEAARSIGIRFGSIDVIQVNGSWQVLEINSGVMMEALGGLHPDLVNKAYSAALDKLFH